MASILRLVPKVDSQSSWTWDDDIKPILQNPEKYSFNEVVGKLKDNISAWDDEDRNAQRRQAIWILILIAYYLGKGEQEHGEIILDLVYEWDFQDDLFHEMKDTAKTYKALKMYQYSVEAWDTQLKDELNHNRSDLDKSIKALIELG